uniref:Uncharacterized protein n=1 Tax=Schistosoma haematobium TaxID=6185 RepID=A0A094ZHH6_SCHHA
MIHDILDKSKQTTYNTTMNNKDKLYKSYNEQIKTFPMIKSVINDYERNDKYHMKRKYTNHNHENDHDKRVVTTATTTTTTTTTTTPSLMTIKEDCNSYMNVDHKNLSINLTKYQSYEQYKQSMNDTTQLIEGNLKQLYTATGKYCI